MFETSDFVSKLTDRFFTISESFVTESYVTILSDLFWDKDNTIQWRILFVLIAWLLLNLFLIKSAWSYYSSDVHNILTSQSRGKSTPKERPRRDTENGSMKRE